MIQRALDLAFSSIIAEQIGVVAHQKKLKNPQFQESYNKYIKVYEVLNSTLNKEQKKLLKELESAQNSMEGFIEEYSYRQGLEDGQTIRKTLIELGILVNGGKDDEH